MNWITFNGAPHEKYLNFISTHPRSSVWHDPSWLSFQISVKKALKGFYFAVEEKDEIIIAGVFLVYRNSRLKISYGYIPAGFLYKRIDERIYDFFLESLNTVSNKEKLVYTQIDSVTPFDEKFFEIIKNKKQHNLTDIHLPIPQYSTLIDLSLSEEEILNRMKPKGRYNIKLAEKKGVVIKKGDKNDMNDFLAMLEVTAGRDGFSINSGKYYEQMIEKVSNTELLLAFFDNKIIAGGIFSYTKNTGLYYYGASGNEYRNLMAPYLLQWSAIKKSKENGAFYYDFLGISEPDKEDRLAGVTDFKLKFGGEIVKFNPSYHIIHNSFFYRILKILKNILKK